MMMGMIGESKPAASPVSVTFGSASITTATDNPHTFTSIALPAAQSGRIIVVATSMAAAVATWTSCTLAGSSMTKITDVSGANFNSALWYIADSSNTSANLVITASAAPNDAWAYAAWGVYSSTGTPNDFDAVSINGGPPAPSLNTVTVQNNGILIAYCFDGTTYTSCAWGTPVTEDFDAVKGGNAYGHTGGSKAYASGSTPTIAPTLTTGAANQANMLACAFQP